MITDPFFALVPQREEFPLEPARTALVLIDMQYLCADPNYGYGMLASDLGREDLLSYRFEAIRKVIPNIQQLQRACRASGSEVIFVRVANLTTDGRDGLSATRARASSIPTDSREAQILDELAPLPNEIVLSKTSSGAFNSSIIDQVLRNLGIEHLLITGVVTNGCVELTARDAADRGYYVTIVSDGCCAGTPELHENALVRMGDGHIIEIRTAAEIMQRLAVWAG